MKTMNRKLVLFGWRLLLAAPFLIVGISGIFSVMSIPLIILGAIIIAGPFADIVSEPFGGLYHGWNRHHDPPPTLSIAQSMRKSGRFEEALAELETVTQSHAGYVDVWVEMLDLVMLDMRDAARAEAILQRGKAAMESPADAAALDRVFAVNLKLGKLDADKVDQSE